MGHLAPQTVVFPMCNRYGGVLDKSVKIVAVCRRLPRRIVEGIWGIFRGDATKVGDEKTGEIDTFILDTFTDHY